LASILCFFLNNNTNNNNGDIEENNDDDDDDDDATVTHHLVNLGHFETGPSRLATYFVLRMPTRLATMLE